MADEHAGDVLIPEEIKAVEFYGDQLTGALVRSGEETVIYVPLRPLATFLGLNWSAQYRRAQRDEVLAPELRGVAIMATPHGGGTQEMVCLPLELLPGWLFGITTSKVKPEYREKINRYRRECYRRLLETRLTQAAQWARGIDDRVTALELRLGDEHPITAAQAADVALAVKTVAHALEQRGTPNGYQRVYGELYRAHGISSYKNLPRSAFDEVMQWLRRWYDELIGDTTT